MSSRFVKLRRSPLRRTTFRVEILEGRSLLSADLASLVGPFAAPAEIAHADLTATPLATGPGEASPFAGTAARAPYTPSQIRHAYGVDQLAQDGTGQTIALVDAYNDPTIASDLAKFDSTFGLATASLSVVYTKGTGSTSTAPASNSGWAGEIALDVEWAHVIAPKAKLMLVEAASSSFTDLIGGVQYAASHGANVVSMSWGGGDSGGDTSSDGSFNATGVSYFASSGDSGAGVSYPAASPNVVGVGGTLVSLDSSGNKLSESAWTGSGGGTSAYEARPSYQSGFQSATKRGVPDVSYNADPNSGVYVYNNGGWEQVGGTSAGSPQWAALAALVNQGRAAAGSAPLGTSLDAALYALAGKTSYTNPNGDFTDVTTGSSNANGSNASIAAKAGYDLVTGLGSPVANKLVPDLINYGTSTGSTGTSTGSTGGTSSGSGGSSGGGGLLGFLASGRSVVAPAAVAPRVGLATPVAASAQGVLVPLTVPTAASSAGTGAEAAATPSGVRINLGGRAAGRVVAQQGAARSSFGDFATA